MMGPRTTTSETVGILANSVNPLTSQGQRPDAASVRIRTRSDSPAPNGAPWHAVCSLSARNLPLVRDVQHRVA